MKTILASLAVTILLLSTSTLVFGSSTELGYRYINTNSNTQPGSSVSWYHNTLDMTDIAGTGERTEVTTAFATWQNDAGSYIQFSNAGTTSTVASSTANPPFQDSLKVVQYNANLGCTMDNCPLAVTAWFPSGSTYSDIDMAFNDAHFTFSNATPTPSGQYDLQSVALHEIGHWLILDDLLDNHSSPAGPAENHNMVMAWHISSATQKRTLQWGDIAGVRFIYANTNPAGSGIGSDQQGADLAQGLVNSGTTRDYVFAWVENPSGANTIKYSYGWDISSSTGAASSWSTPASITSVGDETQGVGVALAQINNDANGRPDLVIAWMDNPFGANVVKYRIGWDVNTSGVPASWSTDKIMDNSNVGGESQGLGIAFVDTPDAGANPEMFVFWVDNPVGSNKIYYKIGWNINTSGDPTGGWSARIDPGILPGDETQGLGISIGNWLGTSNNDVIVFWIDNPVGNNHGYYRVGQDVTSTGSFTWTAARDTFPQDWRFVGTETQGAGVTLLDVNSDSRLDVSFAWIDNPAGTNAANLRTEWSARMGTGSHD